MQHLIILLDITSGKPLMQHAFPRTQGKKNPRGMACEGGNGVTIT